MGSEDPGIQRPKKKKKMRRVHQIYKKQLQLVPPLARTWEVVLIEAAELIIVVSLSRTCASFYQSLSEKVLWEPCCAAEIIKQQDAIPERKVVKNRQAAAQAARNPIMVISKSRGLSAATALNRGLTIVHDPT